MIAATLLLTCSLLSPEVEKPPLFWGTGDYRRGTVLKDAELTRYFDQGLSLIFAFQKGEAEKTFDYVISKAPECALAYWGAAMAVGPDINKGNVTEAANKRAVANLENGEKVAKTDLEKALIQAAKARFSTTEKSRFKLNTAYSQAMKKVWAAFPNDPDAGAFYAESLMILSPWSQWNKNGTPRPGTEEAVKTLEEVVKISPKHPLAHHLYIHAIEGSLTPERAVPSADILRELQPGLGHNVHMPSHIYVRVGMWDKAVVQNQKAVEQDRIYVKTRKPLEDHANYMSHNQMMLAFAASMNGQSKVAIKVYDDMDAQKGPAGIYDTNLYQRLDLYKRMGMWGEILATPDYDKKYPLSRVMRHGFRSIAFAAQKQGISASQELQLFVEGRKKLKSQNRLMLDTMEHLAKGEVAYLGGLKAQGILELRKAVASEDKFGYREPPDWTNPTRHTLGAALLDNSQLAEAEKVYRDDLKLNPDNGWSLMGLAKTLAAQGKTEEAEKTMARQLVAWKNADITIGSSCLCLPGKQK